MPFDKTCFGIVALVTAEMLVNQLYAASLFLARRSLFLHIVLSHNGHCVFHQHHLSINFRMFLEKSFCSDIFHSHGLKIKVREY